MYISAEKNSQEKIRVYEIGGTNPLTGRHFVNSCDALILVFDITSFDSFVAMQKIKAEVSHLAPHGCLIVVSLWTHKRRALISKYSWIFDFGFDGMDDMAT